MTESYDNDLMNGVLVLGSTNVPQHKGLNGSEVLAILSEASSSVLCVGDIHLSDRPPSSCTETYTEDILDMLRYVAKIEKAFNIDAVVWAGDVFHHKQPSRTSHQTVFRLAEVAQEYQNLYVVTGNHDISNDRLDSLSKQPLGVLYQAGILKELNGWHPTLPIFGVPWQQYWSAPGAIETAFKAYRERVHASDENHGNIGPLAVTHAPIYPPSVADNVLFDLLPLDEVSAAMWNQGSLYYGHIHEPHYKFEVDGVQYANMGAISRGSLHEYNLARKIQIALWTPEHGFNPIDIPHKPASEVFRLDIAAEKKEEKMSLDSFLADVGSATLDMSATETVVEHIRRLEVSKPVKDTSIQLLEEASQ